jgi:hypothetical protein
MCSGSSNIDNMMTLRSGWDFCSACRVAKPSPLGIRMSRITTSGRTRGTSATRSSPVIASPTTLMSGAVSNARLIPSSIKR